MLPCPALPCLLRLLLPPAGTVPTHLATPAPTPPSTPATKAPAAAALPPLPQDGGAGAAKAQQRVHVCTSSDSLRAVVERLSVPGVRRLVVVHPDSKRVEGVVSLSDVASYLLT